MAKPKTFISTIYCGNCCNVGAYEFRRGAILHASRETTWAEHRNFVPGGDDRHVIRLNDRINGQVVACKFCKCSTALHVRERQGDAQVADVSVAAHEDALASGGAAARAQADVDCRNALTEKVTA